MRGLVYKIEVLETVLKVAQKLDYGDFFSKIRMHCSSHVVR